MTGLPGSRQWGLTPPISVTLPTEKELTLNDLLIAELKSQNNFESPEETERRVNVLSKLQHVTIEFVKHVGRLKGLPPSVIDNAGGKVFTFGSYRLGVYGPGSDIDTLIVAPKHVSRDEFFEHFPPMLEKLSTPGSIAEMTPVPDAHVPIIKLEYAGISIDLIFARLVISSIPTSLDLKDKGLLRGLDETDLRSINGTRVTDEILSSVPQVKTFRHALRAIKLWAQRRAVYANVMGFPGGVAWAMMVARICQLYPQASGSIIVARFFHLMAPWPWPRPIMLKQIEEGPLQVRVWNPQIYAGDKRHLMPIITPAYPSMCATHNITLSTKKVIVRELERANAITNEIFGGKKQWKELFQKHTFFTEGYKYYLSVIAGSRSKDSQTKWSGLVQSKVRRLVTGIEMSDAGVEVAHPFNKGFDRVHRCNDEEEANIALQGSLQFQVAEPEVERVNGSESDRRGSDNGIIIYTTTYYVGIELMQGAKSLDISFPVADFKRQCTDWPQFNSDLSCIRIVHTRNYDLPADVFEAGEMRPVRSKKSKTKSQSKRTATDAGLEEMKFPSLKRLQSDINNSSTNDQNGNLGNTSLKVEATQYQQTTKESLATAAA